MDITDNILRQYLFLIPLVVLVLCELVKVFIKTIKAGENIFSFHWATLLFHPGGIPSTHSSFVTSLLIIVGRKQGLDSIAFAITFVFAAIVWYDSMSIRYQVGKQAEVLNKLQHQRHFSERLGHSFVEVIAGIIFGAGITIIGIWLS